MFWRIVSQLIGFCQEGRMRVIKLKNVTEVTGLSKASIYRFIKDKKFPPQIKLGQRSSGWVEEEVFQWLKSRMDARG